MCGGTQSTLPVLILTPAHPAPYLHTLLIPPHGYAHPIAPFFGPEHTHIDWPRGPEP